MLGRRERRQPELFVAGTLRELLPDDHVLVRVDRLPDLRRLRAEGEPLYRIVHQRRSGPHADCRLNHWSETVLWTVGGLRSAPIGTHPVPTFPQSTQPLTAP